MWESQEAWEAFGQERMGPAAAELGISMKAAPPIHDAHEILIVKTLTQAQLIVKEPKGVSKS